MRKYLSTAHLIGQQPRVVDLKLFSLYNRMLTWVRREHKWLDHRRQEARTRGGAYVLALETFSRKEKTSQRAKE